MTYINYNHEIQELYRILTTASTKGLIEEGINSYDWQLEHELNYLKEHPNVDRIDPQKLYEYILEKMEKEQTK